jgi:[ribosomal protein S18]-alanine N-acetyltransferase
MVVIRHARQNELGLLAAIGLRGPAERAFVDFLAGHWLSVLLVEEDKGVRGWAAREDLDDTISDLWIDPEAQGKGLGALLLAEVERRIAADGFDVASARTHAQNTSAVAFFQRAGYQVKWLSTAYSQRLDRDVEFIGLAKQLAAGGEVAGFLGDW